MGNAKDIELKPIAAKVANDLIRRVHYSGKVVQNSQLHIGVFFKGRLEGALQFGPSLDKRKIMGLVSGTGWNEFIELNRLAFTDALPRNSESRAISVALRLLRKHAPHLKWVVSFADAAQCGDGAIYRAVGFVLTAIKKNTQIWEDAGGATVSRTAMTAQGAKGASRQKRAILSRVTVTEGTHIAETGAASMQPFIRAGYKPIPGFQLRYIHFLDPTYRQRLTVPEIPYSKIQEVGAAMYKGERLTRGLGEIDNAPDSNRETGGARPTSPLKQVA